MLKERFCVPPLIERAYGFAQHNSLLFSARLISCFVSMGQTHKQEHARPDE